jgi:hypothetical protein
MLLGRDKAIILSKLLSAAKKWAKGEILLIWEKILSM